MPVKPPPGFKPVGNSSIQAPAGFSPVANDSIDLDLNPDDQTIPPTAPSTAEMRPADTGLTRWLEAAQNDIRHGGTSTWLGRGFHAIGGQPTGDDAMGDIMAGPLIGPLEAAEGVSRAANPESTTHNRVVGANKIFSGIGKTVALPAMATGQAEVLAPTVGLFGAANAGMEKAGEHFGLDPDEAQLVSNLATVGIPTAKAAAPKVGEFIQNHAAPIAKTGATAYGLTKAITTKNPLWMLTDSHRITEPLTTITRGAGKAIQAVGNQPLFPHELVGDYNPEMTPHPEEPRGLLTSGPLITPPPEPNTEPNVRLSQTVTRGKGGRMVKQTVQGLGEPGTTQFGTIERQPELPPKAPPPFNRATAAQPVVHEQEPLVNTEPLTKSAESPIIKQEENMPNGNGGMSRRDFQIPSEKRPFNNEDRLSDKGFQEAGRESLERGQENADRLANIEFYARNKPDVSKTTGKRYGEGARVPGTSGDPNEPLLPWAEHPYGAMHTVNGGMVNDLPTVSGGKPVDPEWARNLEERAAEKEGLISIPPEFSDKFNPEPEVPRGHIELLYDYLNQDPLRQYTKLSDVKAAARNAIYSGEFENWPREVQDAANTLLGRGTIPASKADSQWYTEDQLYRMRPDQLKGLLDSGQIEPDVYKAIRESQDEQYGGSMAPPWAEENQGSVFDQTNNLIDEKYPPSGKKLPELDRNKTAGEFPYRNRMPNDREMGVEGMGIKPEIAQRAYEFLVNKHGMNPDAISRLDLIHQIQLAKALGWDEKLGGLPPATF